MAIDPRTTSETDIHRMVDDGAYPKLNAETLMSGRVNELPPIPSIPLITEQVRKLDLSAWPMAQALISTTKRHGYVFERVPVGHDMGWRCYAEARYDGDPADGDTDCGYGLTQDAAYADYVGAEPKPSRPTVTDNLGSPFDAPEMREAMYGDANFDEDLEETP